MSGRAEFWLWPVSIVGAVALHGGLAALFAGTVAEAAVPPPVPLQVTISTVPSVSRVTEPVAVATAVEPPLAAAASAVAVQAAPAVATQLAAAAVAVPVQALAPVAPQVADPVQTVAAQEVATLTAAPVAPILAMPAVPAPLTTTAIAASEASAVPTQATAAPVTAAPAIVAIPETLSAATPGSDSGNVATAPVAVVAAAEPIAVAVAAEATAPAMTVTPTAVSVAAAAGIPLASASPGIGSVVAAPASSDDTAGTVAPVTVANAAPTVAAPAGTSAVAVGPGSNVATAGAVAPAATATAAAVMAAPGTPMAPAGTIATVPSATIATAAPAGNAPQVIAGEEDVLVANIPDVPVVEAPAGPLVPNPETLSEFLGGYDGGNCFAARIDTVNGSATLAAYAVDFADSVALQLALGESFEAPVDVAGYRAEPSQCGALAFVSGMQRRAGGWLALSLAAERLADGETLTGTIVGSIGATIHLFIVDDEGTVSDVGPYVEVSGTTASFAVPVHLTGDAATKLQLVIAVAAGSTLVPPADGQAAEPFFAELTQRLAETGGPAGIAIAAFALE